MTPDYLHNHPDFADLIRIVAEKKSIDYPALVEKDYWIMHGLYGLQQMGLQFELKGGTSLSKGYGVIQRFSEDIDIRIEPPPDMNVKTSSNHDKPAHCESRKNFYDWLAGTIKIDGIIRVDRDTAFDDAKYRSGGIRLHYDSKTATLPDLKEGILLEVGFDDITPNQPRLISSWAYDHAVSEKVAVIDNRARDIICYHPGYTLVEKLQTISTKFRQQQASGKFPINFMRHYYDIYCLLEMPEVQAFIGTPAYLAHKERRFRSGDNLVIAKNEAFSLSDKKTRGEYAGAYSQTPRLYYAGQPAFDEILKRIHEWAAKL
jgi:hypothetical protein